MGSRSFEPLVRFVTKKDNSTGDMPTGTFDEVFILFASVREDHKIPKWYYQCSNGDRFRSRLAIRQI